MSFNVNNFNPLYFQAGVGTCDTGGTSGSNSNLLDIISQITGLAGIGTLTALSFLMLVSSQRPNENTVAGKQKKEPKRKLKKNLNEAEGKP